LGHEGRDYAVIPGLGGPKGTLHLDLLRVPVQDGFCYDLLDPVSGEATNWLQAHLTRGWPAMILERRKETGGLHWVVTAARRNGELRLMDSLAAESPLVWARSYLQAEVISVLLLRKRKDDDPDPPFWAVHLEGIAKMERVGRRLGEMKGRRWEHASFGEEESTTYSQFGPEEDGFLSEESNRSCHIWEGRLFRRRSDKSLQGPKQNALVKTFTNCYFLSAA
jgi:hypothetical protein